MPHLHHPQQHMLLFETVSDSTFAPPPQHHALCLRGPGAGRHPAAPDRSAVGLAERHHRRLRHGREEQRQRHQARHRWISYACRPQILDWDLKSRHAAPVSHSNLQLQQYRFARTTHYLQHHLCTSRQLPQRICRCPVLAELSPRAVDAADTRFSPAAAATVDSTLGELYTALEILQQYTVQTLGQTDVFPGAEICTSSAGPANVPCAPVNLTGASLESFAP